MLYYIILAGAFLAGLLVNSLLRQCIRELANETEGLETTRNNFLKQMKLRYENCLRIGHEIRNTEAFAEKYLDKYKKYGIGIGGYEKMSAVISGACVIAGMAGAMMERNHAMEFLLLGFLSMYIISGSRRLMNVQSGKRRIMLNIVDFFENRYLTAASRDTKESNEQAEPQMAKTEKTTKMTYTDEERKLIDDILREYLG